MCVGFWISWAAGPKVGRCGNISAFGPAVLAEESGRGGAFPPDPGCPAWDGWATRAPPAPPKDCPTPVGRWGRISGRGLHRQTFRETDGLVEALGFSDRSEEAPERVMRCTGVDHHRRVADG